MIPISADISSTAYIYNFIYIYIHTSSYINLYYVQNQKSLAFFSIAKL